MSGGRIDAFQVGSMALKTALGGLAIAGLVALSASDLTVFGIAFWKIALAAGGAVIFMLGRDPGPRPGR